ncbi:MAG: lysoplasmalogenase family protein [Clostridiales bacterium]|nr:lysoplasmalogenase family protein [Clostridiales bacterium]
MSDFLLENFSLSNKLKYAVVVLCALNAFVQKDDFLKKAAFAATLFADFFIIFTDIYSVGVTVFCAAHIFYFLRNVRDVKKLKIYIVFLFVFLTVLIFAGYLNAIAAFYALCLLNNFFSSFRAGKTIFVAALLFVLCDVFVLAYNLPRPVSAAGLIIWIFYAPSQLLYSISELRNTER